MAAVKLKLGDIVAALLRPVLGIQVYVFPIDLAVSLVLVFFTAWMLFLDNYSYFDHRFLDKQIDELEDNKTYYQEEIKNDKRHIKELKNIEYVEKYAREKYYMKKDSEDIYIIEFEGDSAIKTK